jgi:hypothetical protein
MNPSTLIPFKYGVVSSDIAVNLQNPAERLRSRIRKSSEDIIEIGRDLLAVTEGHLFDHGRFVAWVENEASILRRSA